MNDTASPTQTVFQAETDSDTLGGRISRARDALNLTTSQLARRLGVKSETVAAWESDRSEPRANRLTMLAGVMGVSPTWLLNGIGEAPVDDRIHSELHLLELQVSKLKQNQNEAAKIITALENELHRVSINIEK